VALLVAVGVSDEGHREVFAVETTTVSGGAAGERSETWRGLLQGLIGRGLRGVKLVISDSLPHSCGDHEAIKSAVQVEFSGATWQRCTVHFQRNVFSHVPQRESKKVASDLKQVFQAARRETAEMLAAGF
jgi:transposase-like protein